MSAPHGHPGYSPYPGPMTARPRPGFTRGRALPVVVACGLAMGVFAGLLIVRGTGEGSGEGGGETTVVSVSSGEAADAGAGGAAPAPADAAPSGAEVASAPPDAGGAAPPARPAVAVLRFDVSPSGATVLVDGERVEGGSIELPLEKGVARVRVQVRARGYRSSSQTIEVTGDRTVEIDLKRAVKRDGNGRPDGPGGLIDL